MQARVLLNCKEFGYLIKNTHIQNSSASDWRKYASFCFKENARTFSKNSVTQGNIRISRLKKRLRNFYKKKKKNSNQLLNQWLETYKMSFINKKTKKKKVLNFVLTSHCCWRAKNTQKHFSKYLKERICKVKQYLNYILMIINRNILAILRTLDLRKNYEKFYT